MNLEKFFNVVLVEPEIPQNTGNIGRTCVGTNSELHLVGKLGFEINDYQLRRAGLDYWPHLKWQQYEKFQDWKAVVPDAKRVFYLTTKAEKSYFEMDYQLGDWFVFGKETKGLDEALIKENFDRAIKIPQFGPVRSLNVATTVAIVLYEAIRQVKIIN